MYDENNPSADPDIKIIYIDKDLAKEIQKKRLQKKMSQQQLANAVSLPVSVINDYEKGTGIRNGSYITKIKKFLNM
jgi:ribosome-binding protein aMBF1 (putative translation factor)